MEKAHGVGQDVEAMRVCNLLLAGAQVPADSEDATKFRATFPRPMSQALSMEEYEAQVEEAFEDIASSTRLARRPEDNAANVPRRGLFSALAGIFSSNGSLHEPDGRQTTGVYSSARGNPASNGGPLSHLGESRILQSLS